MNRLRSVAAVVLLVLTCVMLLATTLSIWVSRTLFDTDTVADVVDESLQEPAVTEAVTVFITRELTDALAESEALDEAIPDSLERATPIVEAALYSVIEDQTRRLVSSDTGRRLVVETVRAAHRAAVAVVESEPLPDDGLVVVDDDAVSLNLLPVIAAVVDRLQERGILDEDLDLSAVRDALTSGEQVEVLGREIGVDLDDDFGQVVVYERRADDALSVVGSAQRAVEVLHRVQVLQVVATLLLAVLAVVAARDRRRMGIALGAGVLVAFVLTTLVVRRVTAAIPQLLTDPVARDAVRDLVDITTSDLDEALVRVVVLAVITVAVLILWLAPGVRARLAALGTRWPLAVRIGAVTLGLLVLVVLGLRLVPMLLAIAVVAVGLVSTRPAATSLTEPTGPSADG